MEYRSQKTVASMGKKRTKGGEQKSIADFGMRIVECKENRAEG